MNRTLTIAIQSPGDMGHGVGRHLRERGFEVITALAGRSARTRALARQAGIADAGELEALVARADLVLSIMPPASALPFAERLAETIQRTAAATGRRPVVADCNAVSPETVRKIARRLEAAGATFIDAGIIGLAPGRSALPTRFYASGPDTAMLEALDGGSGSDGLRVHRLGAKIGLASTMKMVYAAITKGTMTLHASALVAAAASGLSEAFHAELAESQPAVWAAMQRMTPRLPLDAARWVGEMHEIAATLRGLGLPGGYHDAAAEVFSALARTPIAAETRETVDPARTLDQALAVYIEVFGKSTQ